MPPLQGPDNAIWRAVVDVASYVWLYVDPDEVDLLATHYREIDTLFQQGAEELERQAEIVETEAWLDSNGTVFANGLRGLAEGLRALGQEAMARSNLAIKYAKHIRAYRREIQSELAFLVGLSVLLGGIPLLAGRLAGGIARNFFMKAHSLIKTFASGLEFEGMRAGMRLSGKQLAQKLGVEFFSESGQEFTVDALRQWFANLAGDQKGYDAKQGAKATVSGAGAVVPASIANKGVDGVAKQLSPRRRADPEANAGQVGQAIQGGVGSAAGSPVGGMLGEAVVEGDLGILFDGQQWGQAMSPQNLVQAGLIGAGYPPTLNAANYVGDAGWKAGGGDPPNNNNVGAGPTAAGDPATGEAGAPAVGEAGASTEAEASGAPGSAQGGSTGAQVGSSGNQTGGGNAGSATIDTSDPSSSSESASDAVGTRPPVTGNAGTGTGTDAPIRPGTATTNAQPQQQDQHHSDARPEESSLDENDDVSGVPVGSGEQTPDGTGAPTEPSSVGPSGGAADPGPPTDPIDRTGTGHSESSTGASTDTGDAVTPGTTTGTGVPAEDGATAVPSEDDAAGTSTLAGGNANDPTNLGVAGGVAPVITAGSPSSPPAVSTGPSASNKSASKGSDDDTDTANDNDAGEEARSQTETAESGDATELAAAGSEVEGDSEVEASNESVAASGGRPSSERVLDREQNRNDKRSKSGRRGRDRRDVQPRPAPTGPGGSMAPPTMESGRTTTERGPGQDPTTGVAAETTNDPQGPVPVGAGAATIPAPTAVPIADESATDVADAAPPEGSPVHTAVGAPVARHPGHGEDAQKPEISNGSGPVPLDPSPRPDAASDAGSGGLPTNPPTPPPTDQGPPVPGPDPNDDGDDGASDGSHDGQTTPEAVDSGNSDYAVPVLGYPAWPGNVIPPTGPMESGPVPEGQDSLDVLDALIEALEYDTWFIDRVDVVAIREGVVEAWVRSKDGADSFRLVATVGEVHGKPPARITMDRARRTMHLTISDRLSVANAGIRVNATIAFALGVGERFGWTEPLGEDALGISRDPYDVLRPSSRDHGFLALMRYAAALAEKPPEGSPGRLLPDGVDEHRDRRVAERLLTATLHTLGVLQDQPLADRIIDQIPSEDRPLVRRLAEGRKAGSLRRQPEVYLATKLAPTAFIVIPTTVTSLVVGAPVGTALANLLPLLVHTVAETWRQLGFEGSQAETGRPEADPEGPPRGRLAELLPGMPPVPDPDASFPPRALRDYFEKYGWTGVAGGGALTGILLTGSGNPLLFLLYGAMVSLYPVVVRWFDTRVGQRQAERDAEILAKEKNRPDRFENVFAERLAHLFERFQTATGRLQEFGHRPDHETSDSTKVDHTLEDHDPGQQARGYIESPELGGTAGLNHLGSLIGDWVMQRELQRTDAKVKQFDAAESARRNDQSFADLALDLERKMEETVAHVERLAGIRPPSTTAPAGNGLPEVPRPPSPGDRPSPVPGKERFAVYAAMPLLVGGTAFGLVASGALVGSVIIGLIGIAAAQVLTKPASKWLDKRTGLGTQDEARVGVGALLQDRELVAENEAVDNHIHAVLRYAAEQYQRDLTAASGSGSDRSGQLLRARDLRTGRFGTDQVRAAVREAQVANAVAAVGESAQRQAERNQRHRLLLQIERRADELDRRSGSKARRRSEQSLVAAYNRYARLRDLGGRATGLPPLGTVDPAGGRRLSDRRDRLLLRVEQARERLARSQVTDPTLLDPLVFLGQLRRLHQVERLVDVERRARKEAVRTGDRTLLDRVTGELDELVAAYDTKLAELGIPGGLAEDDDGGDGTPGAGPPSPDDSDPDGGPSDNGPSTGPAPSGPAPTTQGPDGSSSAKPASAEEAVTSSADRTAAAPDAAPPDASGESPGPRGISSIDISSPGHAEVQPTEQAPAGASPSADPDGAPPAREATSVGAVEDANASGGPAGHHPEFGSRTSTLNERSERTGRGRFRSRLQRTSAALLTLGGVLAANLTGAGTESNPANSHGLVDRGTSAASHSARSDLPAVAEHRLSLDHDQPADDRPTGRPTSETGSNRRPRRSGRGRPSRTVLPSAGPPEGSPVHTAVGAPVARHPGHGEDAQKPEISNGSGPVPLDPSPRPDPGSGGPPTNPPTPPPTDQGPPVPGPDPNDDGDDNQDGEHNENDQDSQPVEVTLRLEGSPRDIAELVDLPETLASHRQQINESLRRWWRDAAEGFVVDVLIQVHGPSATLHVQAEATRGNEHRSGTDVFSADGRHLVRVRTDYGADGRRTNVRVTLHHGAESQALSELIALPQLREGHSYDQEKVTEFLQPWLDRLGQGFDVIVTAHREPNPSGDIVEVGVSAIPVEAGEIARDSRTFQGEVDPEHAPAGYEIVLEPGATPHAVDELAHLPAAFREQIADFLRPLWRLAADGQRVRIFVQAPDESGRVYAHFSAGVGRARTTGAEVTEILSGRVAPPDAGPPYDEMSRPGQDLSYRLTFEPGTEFRAQDILHRMFHVLGARSDLASLAQLVERSRVLERIREIVGSGTMAELTIRPSRGGEGRVLELYVPAGQDGPKPAPDADASLGRAGGAWRRQEMHTDRVDQQVSVYAVPAGADVAIESIVPTLPVPWQSLSDEAIALLYRVRQRVGEGFEGHLRWTLDVSRNVLTLTFQGYRGNEYFQGSAFSALPGSEQGPTTPEADESGETASVDDPTPSDGDATTDESGPPDGEETTDNTADSLLAELWSEFDAPGTRRARGNEVTRLPGPDGTVHVVTATLTESLPSPEVEELAAEQAAAAELGLPIQEDLRALGSDLIPGGVASLLPLGVNVEPDAVEGVLNVVRALVGQSETVYIEFQRHYRPGTEGLGEAGLRVFIEHTAHPGSGLVMVLAATGGPVIDGTPRTDAQFDVPSAWSDWLASKETWPSEASTYAAVQPELVTAGRKTATGRNRLRAGLSAMSRPLVNRADWVVGEVDEEPADGPTGQHDGLVEAFGRALNDDGLAQRGGVEVSTGPASRPQDDGQWVNVAEYVLNPSGARSFRMYVRTGNDQVTEPLVRIDPERRTAEVTLPPGAEPKLMPQLAALLVGGLGNNDWAEGPNTADAQLGLMHQVIAENRRDTTALRSLLDWLDLANNTALLLELDPNDLPAKERQVVKQYLEQAWSADTQPVDDGTTRFSDLGVYESQEKNVGYRLFGVADLSGTEADPLPRLRIPEAVEAALDSEFVRRAAGIHTVTAIGHRTVPASDYRGRNRYVRLYRVVPNDGEPFILKVGLHEEREAVPLEPGQALLVLGEGTPAAPEPHLLQANENLPGANDAVMHHRQAELWLSADIASGRVETIAAQVLGALSGDWANGPNVEKARLAELRLLAGRDDTASRRQLLTRLRALDLAALDRLGDLLTTSDGLLLGLVLNEVRARPEETGAGPGPVTFFRVPEPTTDTTTDTAPADVEETDGPNDDPDDSDPDPDDTDPDSGPTDGPGPTDPGPTPSEPDGSGAVKHESTEQEPITSDTSTTDRAPAGPDADPTDAPSPNESRARQETSIIDIVNPDRPPATAETDDNRDAREPALVGAPPGADVGAGATSGGRRPAPRTTTMASQDLEGSDRPDGNGNESEGPGAEQQGSGTPDPGDASSAGSNRDGSDPPAGGGRPGNEDTGPEGIVKTDVVHTPESGRTSEIAAALPPGTRLMPASALEEDGTPIEVYAGREPLRPDVRAGELSDPIELAAMAAAAANFDHEFRAVLLIEGDQIAVTWHQVRVEQTRDGPIVRPTGVKITQPINHEILVDEQGNLLGAQVRGCTWAALVEKPSLLERLGQATPDGFTEPQAADEAIRLAEHLTRFSGQPATVVRLPGHPGEQGEVLDAQRMLNEFGRLRDAGHPVFVRLSPTPSLQEDRPSRGQWVEVTSVIGTMLGLYDPVHGYRTMPVGELQEHLRDPSGPMGDNRFVTTEAGRDLVAGTRSGATDATTELPGEDVWVPKEPGEPGGYSIDSTWHQEFLGDRAVDETGRIVPVGQGNPIRLAAESPTHLDVVALPGDRQPEPLTVWAAAAHTLAPGLIEPLGDREFVVSTPDVELVMAPDGTPLAYPVGSPKWTLISDQVPVDENGRLPGVQVPTRGAAWPVLLEKHLAVEDQRANPAEREGRNELHRTLWEKARAKAVQMAKVTGKPCAVRKLPGIDADPVQRAEMVLELFGELLGGRRPILLEARGRDMNAGEPAFSDGLRPGHDYAVVDVAEDAVILYNPLDWGNISVSIETFLRYFYVSNDQPGMNSYITTEPDTHLDATPEDESGPPGPDDEVTPSDNGETTVPEDGGKETAEELAPEDSEDDAPGPGNTDSPYKDDVGETTGYAGPTALEGIVSILVATPQDDALGTDSANQDSETTPPVDETPPTVDESVPAEAETAPTEGDSQETGNDGSGTGRFRTRLLRTSGALLTFGGVVAAILAGGGTQSESADSHALDASEVDIELVSSQTGLPAPPDLAVLPTVAEHPLAEDDQHGDQQSDQQDGPAYSGQDGLPARESDRHRHERRGLGPSRRRRRQRRLAEAERGWDGSPSEATRHRTTWEPGETDSASTGTSAELAGPVEVAPSVPETSDPGTLAAIRDQVAARISQLQESVDLLTKLSAAKQRSSEMASEEKNRKREEAFAESELADSGAAVRKHRAESAALSAEAKQNRHAEIAQAYQRVAQRAAEARDAGQRLADEIAAVEAGQRHDTDTVRELAEEADARVHDFLRSLDEIRPPRRVLPGAAPDGPPPHLAALTARVNQVLADNGIRHSYDEKTLRWILWSEFRQVTSDDGLVLTIDGYARDDVTDVAQIWIQLRAGELSELLRTDPNAAEASEIIDGKIDHSGYDGSAHGTQSQARTYGLGSKLIAAMTPDGHWWKTTSEAVPLGVERGGSDSRGEQSGSSRDARNSTVLDNRAEAVPYEASAVWEVRGRASALGPWSTPEVVDGGTSENAENLRTWISHAYTGPGPETTTIEAEGLGEARSGLLPEHKTLYVNGLEGMADDVVSKTVDLLGRLDRIAHDHIRHLFTRRLPSQLLEASRPGGIGQVIVVDGRPVAYVQVRARVDVESARMVGRWSSENWMERLRVGFTGVSGGQTFNKSGSWSLKGSVGMSDLGSSAVDLKPEASGGRGAGRNDGTNVARSAIDVGLRRCPTTAAGVRISYEATVYRLDTGESRTSERAGDAMLRLAENDAFWYGLPVDVNAVERNDDRTPKTGDDGRTLLRADPQPTSQALELPSWFGNGTGQLAGPAQVRLAEAESARDKFIRALSERGVLPPLNDDLSPNMAELPLDRLLATSQLNNLQRVRQLFPTVAAETWYADVAKHGITVQLPVHQTDKAPQTRTFRLRLRQDFGQATYLGLSPYATVRLPIGSDSTTRSRGRSKQWPWSASLRAGDSPEVGQQAGFTARGGRSSFGRSLGWSTGSTVNRVSLIEPNAEVAEFLVQSTLEISETDATGRARQVIEDVECTARLQIDSELCRQPPGAQVRTDGSLPPGVASPGTTDPVLLDSGRLMTVDIDALAALIDRQLPAGARLDPESEQKLAHFLHSTNLATHSGEWRNSGYRTHLTVNPSPSVTDPTDLVRNPLGRHRSVRVCVTGQVHNERVVAVSSQVTGDIRLIFQQAGVSEGGFTQSDVGAGSVDGMAGPVESTEFPVGFGRTGNPSWTGTTSSTNGSESLIVRGVEGLHYVLLADATFEVQIDNTDPKQVSGTMLFAVPEQDALRLYGQGRRDLPFGLVADAIERLRTGKLKLDRRSMVGVLSRYQAARSSSVQADVIEGPAARHTAEERLALFEAVSGRELPVSESETAEQVLEAALAEGPTEPAEVDLPEHYTRMPAMAMVERAVDTTDPDQFLDLLGTVRDAIAELSPEVLSVDPVLAESLSTDLAGEAWREHLENMLDPKGFERSYTVRESGTMAGEELTVRITARFDGPVTIDGNPGDPTKEDAIQIRQRYLQLLQSRDLGQSTSYAVSADGTVSSGSDFNLGAATDRSRQRSASSGEQLARLQRLAYHDLTRVTRDLKLTVVVERGRRPGATRVQGRREIPLAVRTTQLVPRAFVTPARPGSRPSGSLTGVLRPAPGKHLELPDVYLVEGTLPYPPDETGDPEDLIFLRTYQRLQALDMLTRAGARVHRTEMVNQLSAAQRNAAFPMMAAGRYGYRMVRLPGPRLLAGYRGQWVNVNVGASVTGVELLAGPVNGELGNVDRHQEETQTGMSGNRMRPISGSVGGGSGGTGFSTKVTVGEHGWSNDSVTFRARKETSEFRKGKLVTVGVHVNYHLWFFRGSRSALESGTLQPYDRLHNAATGYAVLTMLEQDYHAMVRGLESSPGAETSPSVPDGPNVPGVNGEDGGKRGDDDPGPTEPPPPEPDDPDPDGSASGGPGSTTPDPSLSSPDGSGAAMPATTEQEQEPTRSATSRSSEDSDAEPRKVSSDESQGGRGTSIADIINPGGAVVPDHELDPAANSEPSDGGARNNVESGKPNRAIDSGQ